MCTICTHFTPAGPTCAFANAPDGATMVAPSPVAAKLPTLSPAEVADRLIVDFWTDFIGVAGPFAFDLGPARDLTVALDSLRPEGATLARDALNAWSDVTGITFVDAASGVAEIVFTDDQPGGFGGPDLLRGDTIESSTVNISHQFINEYGTGIGSISFFYYLHEIGHALGLGHPGQYNASASFGSDATFANDSWQMTVMSYFEQDANPNIDASYAVPVTPMMADVVAIHELYGTGRGVRPGDTSYGGGNTGGGVNMFSKTDNPVSMTIVDTGGIDSIDLSLDHSGVRLDMRPGTFSDILGLVGNLAIAPRSTIENATLGNGDDTITGNGAANAIRAGAGDDTVRSAGGNDTLEGGAGNDLLDGGAGVDTARFTGPIDGYSVTLHDDHVTVSGADGTDTLVSIEALTFGGGAVLAPGGTFDLSAFSGVSALSAAELTTFVEMYIAYFDRAPDAAGLFYWGTRLADGMSLPEIAASFFVQEESQAAFPDAADAAALVDAAYANLLERAPDAAGRTYWIEQLESGRSSREAFMLDLINGAKGNPDATRDVRTVTDKADIGLSFAVIHGLNDTGAARAVMEAYDRTDPSGGLAEARTLIDASAEQAGFTLALAGVVDDPLAFV